MKYYAVKRGRNPGIYTTWKDCQAQTNRFSGAVFKSFNSLSEAEAYLGNQPQSAPQIPRTTNNTPSVESSSGDGICVRKRNLTVEEESLEDSLQEIKKYMMMKSSNKSFQNNTNHSMSSNNSESLHTNHRNTDDIEAFLMPWKKAPSQKYYAVKNGKVPGIYTSWEECQAQIEDFDNPIFKKCYRLEKAQEFMDMKFPFSEEDLKTGNFERFYAVKRGRHPGIYNHWSECIKQIHNYRHSKFQLFFNREEAEEFMKGDQVEEEEETENENSDEDEGDFNEEEGNPETFSVIESKIPNVTKSKKIKYYAVKKGRVPGIYTSWDECKAQTTKYEGAQYKSFGSLEEAHQYLEEGPNNMGRINNDPENGETMPTSLRNPDRPYAFVDGSFNINTKTYGYGGFLQIGEQRIIGQGSGTDHTLAKMRNVAGEILGSVWAIKTAYETYHVPEIDIYYDYQGIECWTNGSWTPRNKVTKRYAAIVKDYRKKGMLINFIKVKGHSNVEGNEIADELAKKAAGVI